VNNVLIANPSNYITFQPNSLFCNITINYKSYFLMTSSTGSDIILEGKQQCSANISEYKFFDMSYELCDVSFFLTLILYIPCCLIKLQISADILIQSQIVLL